METICRMPYGIDERELRQELLNCAVGPLEDLMYDALGAKVDSLSEPDLLVELEKLATVKTGTEVQAMDYPAMITMKNPVQQPTAHSSPAHIHNQPALAKRSTVDMTTDSTITKPCYQCGKMTHTDKTLADQYRLMTAIANTSMDYAPTKLC
jgi:hypothetical protein